MKASFQQIILERIGDVVCVRLKRFNLDEAAVEELGEDIEGMLEDPTCLKVVVRLGPDTLNCRYSMFLAILLRLRRQLEGRGGALKLCEVGPEVMGVFEVCNLKGRFDFAPDVDTAVAALA